MLEKASVMMSFAGFYLRKIESLGLVFFERPLVFVERRLRTIHEVGSLYLGLGGFGHCSTTISCQSMAVVQMHLRIQNLHVITLKSVRTTYNQLLTGKHIPCCLNSSVSYFEYSQSRILVLVVSRS